MSGSPSHPDPNGTPEKVHDEFMAGNRIFVASGGYKETAPKTRCVCSCCMDTRDQSRVIFNAELGSMVVVATPGGIVDDSTRVAIEKAVQAGAKLAVLQSHTGCGAISAVFDWVKYEKEITDPEIKMGVDVLKLAVKEAIRVQEEYAGKGLVIPDPEAKDIAAEINQTNQRYALMKSPPIREAVEKDGLMIVEGVYNVKKTPYRSRRRKDAQPVQSGEFGVLRKIGGSPEAEEELRRLLAANKRFSENHADEIAKVAEGQVIRAVWLGCTSRKMSAHTLTQKGVADGLMPITSPGLAPEELVKAGVMYAVHHDVKVIYVSVHSDCSILNAMYDQVKNGKKIKDFELREVSKHVKKAVEQAVAEQRKGLAKTDEEAKNRAAVLHAEYVTSLLLENEFIKKRVRRENDVAPLGIVGTFTNTRSESMNLNGQSVPSGGIHEMFRVTDKNLADWLNRGTQKKTTANEIPQETLKTGAQRTTNRNGCC